MNNSESAKKQKQPTWLVLILACISLIIAIVQFGPNWRSEDKGSEQTPRMLNLSGVAISENSDGSSFIAKSRVGIQGISGENVTDKNGSFEIKASVSDLKKQNNRIRFWLVSPLNQSRIYSDEIGIAKEFIATGNYNITVEFPIPAKESIKIKKRKSPLEESHQEDRNPPYLLSGEVLNQEGQSLVRARIQFGGKEVYSDSNGKFSIELSHNKQKKILVSKNGFESYSDYKFPKENIRIQLNPK